MKVLEFQGKEIFRSYGIQTPDGKLIQDEKTAFDLDLKFPVIVKSQLPIGGRGKLGGIKTANSEDELKKVCEELLNSKFKGETVKSVLVEENIVHEREMYISITIDKSTNQSLLMAGSEGGVDIEKKAKNGEAKLIKRQIDLDVGITSFLNNYICRELSITNK
ncbi:MAG: ATP-grasp domain-containing protein, partial [Thermoplasmatota archaeon]